MGTAHIPQPMSTPTALGQTYFSEAKTAPMATPGAGSPFLQPRTTGDLRTASASLRFRRVVEQLTPGGVVTPATDGWCQNPQTSGHKG